MADLTQDRIVELASNYDDSQVPGAGRWLFLNVLELEQFARAVIEADRNRRTSGSAEAVAWRTKIQCAMGDFEPAQWIYAYTESPYAGSEPLYASPQPPAGWKLVPIEPTPEMGYAADATLMNGGMPRGDGPYRVWKAMIAAAPPLPGGPQ